MIGMLHDIGRFEQIRIYHTFLDKDSINHGEYGVKVLFDDGLIRKFLIDTEFDEIIKKAILNHNRASIEEGLTESENLHSKIIRDADKIDILFLSTFGDKFAIWERADLSDDKITDEIYNEFMNDKILNYQKIKSSADILVSHFAYVFDINFKESLKLIREEKYIEKIYERFNFNDKETQKRYEEIYLKTIKYLEEKG